MSRDFFKMGGVIILGCLRRTLRFGYVSTVKAYDRHGLFHIAYGKSTNVRFWSITVPICLRYHAVLASGNVYAAADPLSFR